MLFKEFVQRHYKMPLQLLCRRSVLDMEKTLENIMLEQTDAQCTPFLKPSGMRMPTNQHNRRNRDSREIEDSQRDVSSVILLIIYHINAQLTKEVEESRTVSTLGKMWISS